MDFDEHVQLYIRCTLIVPYLVNMEHKAHFTLEIHL